MKKALILLALLALTTCDKVETRKTTVGTYSDVSGVMTASQLVMTDYAMRAALGNNPATAAYVKIENKGTTADRLVSAHCDCAGTATLHEMVMKGDAMEMSEPEGGFPIAPGQTLTFAPGGNHIMLTPLTTRPTEGQIVNVTLTFEKAGPVTLSMPVSNTPLAKKDISDSHDHMKM